MRTTLDLDDDVLQAVRALASAEGRTLSSVVSSLVRRALRPAPSHAEDGGFPVFEVGADAPSLTADTVRRALDE